METYVGDLYVFSFSGPIVLDDPGKIPALEFQYEGKGIHLHRPQRIAPPTWRPIPQLDVATLRRFVPGLPDDPGLLRISVLPVPGRDKDAAALVVKSDELFDEIKRYTDTIFVEYYDSSDSQGRISSFIACFTTWLRVMTHQWWIGIPAEPFTGNAQLSFKLGRKNEIAFFPTPLTRFISAPSTSSLVTRETWIAAFENACNNKWPPEARIAFCDMYQFFYLKNFSAMFILFCSSIEICRDRILAKIGTSNKKLGASSTHLEKHLSEGLDCRIGRNLHRENSTLYNFLKACWIARNNAAHGKKIPWIHNGVDIGFDAVPASEFFSNANKLFNWLDDVEANLPTLGSRISR